MVSVGTKRKLIQGSVTLYHPFFFQTDTFFLSLIFTGTRFLIKSHVGNFPAFKRILIGIMFSRCVCVLEGKKNLQCRRVFRRVIKEY